MQPEKHLRRVVAVSELLPECRVLQLVIRSRNVEVRLSNPVPVRRLRTPVVVLEQVAQTRTAGRRAPVPD